MTNPHSLAFILPVAEVEREGRDYRFAASEDERRVLADRFDLVSVEALSADVTVRDAGTEQGILVSGTLTASLHQRCIVSLEPVPESYTTDFSLLLVDPEMAARMDEEEVYLDPEAPEYDALEGKEIPLGEIVAQTLSITMNPYPRAEGSELNVGNKKGISINEPEQTRENPFAALESLRKES